MSQKFEFLVSFLLRLLSATIIFLFNLYIVKTYDIHDSGSILWIHSIIMFSIPIVLFGSNHVILKDFSYFFKNNMVTDYSSLLLNSIFVVVTTSLVVSIIISLSFDFFLVNILIIFFVLTFLCLSVLFGYVMQAIGKTSYSIFLIGISFTFFNLILLYLFSPKPENYLLLCFFSTIISLLISIYIMYFFFKRFNLEFKSIKLVNYCSLLPFFIISLSGAIINWGAVSISGFFLPSEDITILSLCIRLSVLVSFFLVVVNNILSPKFSILFKEENYTELISNSKNVSFFLTYISLIILSVYALAGNYILSFFGDDFVNAYDILLLLSIAQFINCSCGPVGVLLTMTGKHIVMRNILMILAMLMVILLPILSHYLGLLGVVYLICFVTITQNLVSVFYVKKYLGFWPLSIVYFRT